MDDKKGNIFFSEDEIAYSIILNEKLRNSVVAFVDELERQGVLKMFINGDKLDELAAKFDSLEILTGEFAYIECSKAMLKRDYDSHFYRQVARQIAALNVREKEKIFGYISNLLELWQTPKHSSDLFLATCDLAVRLRAVYARAVDVYFGQKMGEGIGVVPRNNDISKIQTFWEQLTKQRQEIFRLLSEALPLGVENYDDASCWAIQRKRTFDRIDFTTAFDVVDFENTYHSFFGNTPVVGSGKTRAEVKKIVEETYKRLLLKDCLLQIENPKNQTSAKITSMILKSSKEMTLRMQMRYIQAFFMFYREDAHITREVASSGRENNPVKFNNGKRGFNIPS